MLSNAVPGPEKYIFWPWPKKSKVTTQRLHLPKISFCDRYCRSRLCFRDFRLEILEDTLRFDEFLMRF